MMIQMRVIEKKFDLDSSHYADQVCLYINCLRIKHTGVFPLGKASYASHGSLAVFLSMKPNVLPIR